MEATQNNPRPSRSPTDLIPVAIALLYALVAALPDLRTVRYLPAIPALIVALLGVAMLAARRQAPRWSGGRILILAALFRATMVFRPPELSDDIYRYLWDGRILLAGGNPYAAAPAAVRTSDPGALRLQARVNHPELVTIYPPAAELVFAAGAALHGDTRAMKGLLAVLDLATCALLLVILRRLGLPPWRAALYAWHPLPVLEVAGSGHIDGAAVFFFAMTLAFLGRRGAASASAAGITFVLSAGTKLLPIVWLPCLFHRMERRDRALFIAAGLASAAALVLPFLPEIRNGLGTLSTYAHRWEFAGFTFRILRALTGSGGWARALLLVAYALVLAWGLRASRGGRDLEVAYVYAIAFLVLTPTLHAWYALYLAFLLPFVAGPGGLTFSATVFLGYAVLPRLMATGEWRDPILLAAAITLLPLAAALARRPRFRAPRR